MEKLFKDSKANLVVCKCPFCSELLCVGKDQEHMTAATPIRIVSSEQMKSLVKNGMKDSINFTVYIEDPNYITENYSIKKESK